MNKKQQRFITQQHVTMTVDAMARKMKLSDKEVRRYVLTLPKSMADVATTTPSDRRWRLKQWGLLGAAILFLMGLSLLLYVNTFESPFLWDDINLVKNNTSIRSWKNLDDVFTENLGIGMIREKSSSFRPVQVMTYMLDYTFWELNPWGFHLSSALWHGAVGLSLFALVWILFGQPLLAFVTAALFIVHPTHTEAITYISGRADPVSAVFILLTIVFYVLNDRQVRWQYYLGLVLCFALSVLARESALLLLPIFLLVYSLGFRRRPCWKSFAMLAATAGIYIVLRKMEILGAVRPLGSGNVSLMKRIPGFFFAFKEYIRLLFLPFNLHMEYGFKLFEFSQPSVLLGLFSFGSLVALSMWLRTRQMLCAFGLFWFLGGLIPVSNLYPLNAFMAEHWIYLPSMGIFLIMAAGLCWLFQHQKTWQPVATLLFLGLLMYFGILTVKQNEHWQNPIKFYERTLTFAPDSARLYSDLGTAYFTAGRRQDAIKVFIKAIQMKKDYQAAISNLGVAYRFTGKHQEARQAFEKLITLRPNDATAYFRLAETYKDLKMFPQALKVYQHSLKLMPNQAEAYNGLGISYGALAQYDKALLAYQQSLALSPGNARVYNNMATIYGQRGQLQEAVEWYEKAVNAPREINSSGLAVMHHNLGVTYKGLKQYDKAIESLEKAITLKGHRANSYQELAKVYQLAGRDQDAARMRQIVQAIAQQQKNP